MAKEQSWERIVIQTKGDIQNYHIGFSITDENGLDPILDNNYLLGHSFYGLNKEDLFEYIAHHRNLIKAGPIDKEQMKKINFSLKGIKVVLGILSEIPLEEIVQKTQIDSSEIIILN
jgi:hypothetical protein